MTKKSIIIMCVCITIIVGIVLGYYLAQNSKVTKENNIINNSENFINIDNENTLVTTNTEETVILPNTTLVIKQYYKKCGHTIEEEYKVPEDIVNMTKEKTEKYYIGWKVTIFSKEKLEIYREIDDICDEHYNVKDINGRITIYNKDEYGNEKFVKTTDILTKYLSEDDKARLKNGVNIVRKKRLKHFFRRL